MALTSETVPPPPGPADRVAFFDDERRNRRATWRLAAASALGVALMGIPVSIVVTPLVYGVMLICGDIVNLIHPLPHVVTDRVIALVQLVSTVLDQLSSNTHGPAGTPVPRASLKALFVFAAAVQLPGVVVMISSWLGVQALLRRAGVGGILLNLNARTIRMDDLKERELKDTVDEMALAAGQAAPRLVIVDVDAANAAVIGSSQEDATLVVSRGLVTGLSRDEVQAVVGHLIGSIGNGDLKIAFTLVSVFEACGVLVTLLDAPFGPIARTNLRRLARLVTRSREATAAAEADLVGSMLAATVALEGEDDVLGSRRDPPAILIPLVMINVAVKWTLFTFTSLLVGPMLALMWRTRRYLADATAVQLTRNPDSLASALERLARGAGIVPGTQSASYLFSVAPESGNTRDRIGTNSVVAFHPPIARRLKRLHALGAGSNVVDMPGAHARGSRTPLGRLVYALMLLFVGALGALAFGAAFAAVGILVFASIFFAMLALAAIHGIFLLIGHFLPSRANHA
jgi:Zn-dependent protease with chaperone function